MDEDKGATSGGGVRMEIITIEGYYLRVQIFVSLQQNKIEYEN